MYWKLRESFKLIYVARKNKNKNFNLNDSKAQVKINKLRQDKGDAGHLGLLHNIFLCLHFNKIEQSKKKKKKADAYQNVNALYSAVYHSKL